MIIFLDALSISDYVVLNDRIINVWWKDVEAGMA